MGSLVTKFLGFEPPKKLWGNTHYVTFSRTKEAIFKSPTVPKLVDGGMSIPIKCAQKARILIGMSRNLSFLILAGIEGTPPQIKGNFQKECLHPDLDDDR
jgi:hypothetical protein